MVLLGNNIRQKTSEFCNTFLVVICYRGTYRKRKSLASGIAGLVISEENGEVRTTAL